MDFLVTTLPSSSPQECACDDDSWNPDEAAWQGVDVVATFFKDLGWFNGNLLVATFLNPS